jgi:D-sedoheptulose 7-phosphate isomerase
VEKKAPAGRVRRRRSEEPLSQTPLPSHRIRQMSSRTFSETFLSEVQQVAASLDTTAIERVARQLASIRARGGRLFILGVGGSAANASHAVNDFRKIAGIEAYTPTDNVSELTARTNDEGWATVFEAWLRGSRLQPRDGILVLSVGGGSLERQVSPNLVAALEFARSIGAAIMGIVGRDGGYTAKVADALVLIPSPNPSHVTPHAEAFQSVVCHLLVSHPELKIQETKWESLGRRAVFLDRDGVLVRSVIRQGRPHPPATLSEFELVSEAPACLERLKRAGFLLLVVSNQPDVGRGIQQRKVVEQMNDRLRNLLPVDEVFVCYHDDRDHCECRKPKPGMLFKAAEQLGIDLATSYMIGDRWRDIVAGAAAGTKTIWLDFAYAEKAPPKPPDARLMTLPGAVDWILLESGTASS